MRKRAKQPDLCLIPSLGKLVVVPTVEGSVNVGQRRYVGKIVRKKLIPARPQRGVATTYRYRTVETCDERARKGGGAAAFGRSFPLRACQRWPIKDVADQSPQVVALLGLLRA